MKIKKKCWDEADVQKAIESIVNGMSYGQASHIYGIPKTTLYDRVKNVGKLSHHDRKPAFTKLEEIQLVNFSKFMANAGTPVTQETAVDTAIRFAAHR